MAIERECKSGNPKTQPKEKLFIKQLIVMWLTFYGTAAPSWPGVSFFEVRAYSYNPKGNGTPPIIKDGKLHPSVINTNGALLATNHVSRLLAAVTGKHPEHLVAAALNLGMLSYFTIPIKRRSRKSNSVLSVCNTEEDRQVRLCFLTGPRWLTSAGN